MKPIRVLTLSKPYVSSAYRDKLRCLAQDDRLAIGLITPPSWGDQNFEAGDDPYWLRQLPIVANGKNHFHVYRGLRQAINEFRPHIFNIEEEHYSAVTLQCFRLAVQLGVKPVFYTWQNIAKRYPWPFSAIERYVFQYAAWGIAGNQEAADILRDKGFSKEIAIIPQMGTRLPQPDAKVRHFETLRERFQWPQDGMLVTYAGRLVEEKGIQDLLRALAETEGVYALIAGSGPYEGALQILARELGVTGKVFFLGSLSSDQIYDVYRHSQALCLPSLTRANWKEQFGRVLIEAMASGAVPIGSDSGEIPRVIGDAGLVFPEGNAKVLAQRLKTLAQMPKTEFSQLQQRGRERAEQFFSNREIARRFAEVFAAIADQ